jgi:hypothetical protein
LDRVLQVDDPDHGRIEVLECGKREVAVGQSRYLVIAQCFSSIAVCGHVGGVSSYIIK